MRIPRQSKVVDRPGARGSASEAHTLLRRGGESVASTRVRTARPSHSLLFSFLVIFFSQVRFAKS